MKTILFEEIKPGDILSVVIKPSKPGTEPTRITGQVSSVDRGDKSVFFGYGHGAFWCCLDDVELPILLTKRPLKKTLLTPDTLRTIPIGASLEVKFKDSLRNMVGTLEHRSENKIRFRIWLDGIQAGVSWGDEDLESISLIE